MSTEPLTFENYFPGVRVSFLNVAMNKKLFGYAIAYHRRSAGEMFTIEWDHWLPDAKSSDYSVNYLKSIGCQVEFVVIEEDPI